MIKNDPTFLETLTITGQVLAKIALNFWPVLVIGAVAILVLAVQERRAK